MNISEKCVVAINYTLKDDDGNLLDKSGDEPLSYLHGAGSLIPGLEKELDGRTAGENIRVSVAPEDAYGEFHPQLVQVVSKEIFQDVDELQPGMEFEATGENNQTMMVRIDKVDGDQITINGNHPLAGMTLEFDVDVVSVREATAEELEHGHSHG